MIKSVLKLFAFAAVLLMSIVVNRFIEYLWLFFTGFNSNGLSSLFTLLLMVFSFTLLLPLKKENRIRISRVFKEALIFMLIWIGASFSVALLRQPKHASIGLIPAMFYALLKLAKPGFNLRILLREYSEVSPSSTIIMLVAPIPRVLIAQGLGLRSVLKVLKGRARIAANTPGEVFLKSFKNIGVIELQGSLASFVKAVANNWNRETAMVCEAKPGEGFFKIRVRIASDNIRILNNIAEWFSRLEGEEDVNWALKKWLSLKPCVKPIVLPHYKVSLPPETVPERLLVAGNAGDTDRFALEACLSQLRTNSRILILNGREDSCFEENVEKILLEKGFKPYNRNQPKTFRIRGGMEAVVLKKTDLNGKLVEKFSSKPLVAVWLKDSSEDPELDSPLKILRYATPEPKSFLEAEGLLLLNPSKEVLDSFLPTRQGFPLQGRTVMVSAKGVKIFA